MSTQIEQRPEVLPAPAGDELEAQEQAAREIRDHLTALGSEIDDKRDQYNALWRRLCDVQDGVTAIRRRRSRGFPLATGGHIYGIEEAGREW